MSPIQAYHRPSTIEDALDLLGRSEVTTSLLGGGTVLNAGGVETPAEVVDLQGLGLAGLSVDGESLVIGAMTTLRDVMDDDRVPAVLRDLCRREAPNTLRNASTIGGTVAASHSESGLVAGLLVVGATVSLLGTDGAEVLPIADVLSDPTALAGRIITDVRITVGGVGLFEGTGRTPADTPIVLVVGHRSDDGETLFAATGVASQPTLIDPAEIASLDPPADFRGDPDYRRHLAEVLAQRVAARLEGSQS